MSVDWIAAGAALVSLPIVLFLCFTGCTLDRRGIPVPAFTFPAGLNLRLLKLSVTMTIVGVNDTPPPENQSFASALDIPAGGGTLVFSTIDSSTVNTSPPFGQGEIGPSLTLTCDCTLTLEGNPPQQVSLSMAHDGDDAESLDVRFTLMVAGNGADPGDYSLA